ncbi:MAG: hydroxymethylbilane synthase, partial [Planctomycetes bacterium]|nr:hydroxymethylbilane synthase [Planctomycetota bacterium]
DCSVKNLRGNVDTRVKKLTDGEYDAIILAAAGLLRLGYIAHGTLAPMPAMLPPEIVTMPLAPEHWLSASCQGAIAIEGRKADKRVAKLCAALDHGPSRIACEAERAFLRTIEGGCKVPVGVHARQQRDQLNISSGIFAVDGSAKALGNVTVSSDNASDAAVKLAQRLLDDGGRRILDTLRQNKP